MTQRKAPKIPPPVVAACGFAVQRFLIPPGPRTPLLKVVSGTLALSAVLLAGSAERSLHTAGTTANPLHPENSTVLVQSGAFAYTRNPMYLSIVAASLGYTAWRGSSLGLVPAACLALWLDRRQIPAEERALEEKYGAQYRNYMHAVARWIPLPIRQNQPQKAA